MEITQSSRAVISVVSLLLFLPIVGMDLQNPSELEHFHNKVLEKWPELPVLVQDPPSYFLQAKQWVDERAYPIIGATEWYKKQRLYLLKTAPERRITLGSGRSVFLNGTSDANVNDMFESICITTSTDEAVKRFTDAMPVIAGYSAHIGLPIDVIVFPTSVTVYGDLLPLSVPKAYREACARLANADSPMVAVARASVDPAVVYPVKEVRSKRNDPAFFPNANFHPRGMSIQTVRNAYLTRIGIIPPNEPLQLTLAQSELMGTYDIPWPMPEYRLVSPTVMTRSELARELNMQVADFFTTPSQTVQVFTNKDAPIHQSILIMSDSFGEPSAPVFAGAFQSVIQVTTNEMKEGGINGIIERVSRQSKIDRVVFLTNEAGTQRLSTWSQDLSKAAR